MAERADLVAQVASYERALRRRAGERAARAGDPSLAELQRAIGDRRRRRAGVGGEAGARVVAQAEAAQVEGAHPPEGGGRVLAVEPHGPTVRVLRVARPAGLTFVAGQHLKVGARGGPREDFSVASPPHQADLELAVELREGGRVTPALFALAVGDAVDVGERAKGDLRLDGAAAHHLMVATVTGIAPLRAMVLDALHRGTSARFTILHGASHAEELCFHDELAALAEADGRVTYVPTVSRPGEAADRSWAGATGRVDGLAARVAATLDPATTRVYAVGHAGMVDAVTTQLGRAGFTVDTESYGS